MSRRWSRGQALVEFAFVLPLVLITMFLIVETGRIFQAYVTVQNAAREGARYAVTGRGGSLRVDNVKTAAREILGAGLPLLDDPSCSDFCCDLNFLPENYCILVWSKGGYDAAGLPGERVQVQVTYNVRVVTPLLSVIAPYVPVTGRVEMINEPFGPTGQAHAGIAPPTLGIPPTFTPTFTPTPTATPIALTINEPLRPGDTVVTGYADTRFGEMLIVIRDQSTGQTIGTGNMRPDGTFRISVTPALVAEHKIRAISQYGHDEAVVGAATSTPTETLTPTSTATGTATATSTATGTSTATPTNTPTPYDQRVNCGDGDYTDGSGNLWAADRAYTPGGWGHAGLVTLVNSGACSSVAGTTETGLYNSYTLAEYVTYYFDNVTNGQYQITLLFVEPEKNGSGQRVFDAAIEGKMVIDNLDIYAQVGKCAAYSRSFTVNVTDGTLDIDFAPIVGQAILSAIDISFTAYPPTPTPTSTPTFTPAPTDTPTETPLVPPDLTITGLSLVGGQPITTCWTSPITFTAEVANLSTGPCNQFFWTDLYVSDTPPEPNQSGVAWQGLNGLGPLASKVITFTHSFSISGTHHLYAQADSFQFVSEISETNNIGGPLSVEVQCQGEAPTPTPTPTPHPDCGDVSGTVWAFIGGQLVVPSERVQVEIYQPGDLPVGTALTNELGQYSIVCVPPTEPGEYYTVLGTVDIDDVLYIGQESGIELPPGGEITNLDVILYPLL